MLLNYSHFIVNFKTYARGGQLAMLRRLMDSITLLRILSRVDKLKLQIMMFFLPPLNIK